jgi:hypothetical protein
MSQTNIARPLKPVPEKAATEFPIVILAWPRQSGKTRHSKHRFWQIDFKSSLVIK